jgi:predicted transcriptional regulator
MAKKAKKQAGRPGHYLREWREYREMTQEALAAAVKPPTKASVISLLESGNRDLKNKWLERLAPALRTRKGFILDMNPLDADTRILELVEDMADSEKEQAIAILRTFRSRVA